MSIGKRLTKIRREQSTTQVDFAKLMGVSQSAYKNYERGATEPPVALLVDISSEFNVDIAWLILGVGAPNTETAKTLIERSVVAVERFVDQNKESLSPEGKAAAISLVFEYLSEHPDSSEKFINSVMSSALAKE